jgi:hypothetical protein
MRSILFKKSEIICEFSCRNALKLKKGVGFADINFPLKNLDVHIIKCMEAERNFGIFM